MLAVATLALGFNVGSGVLPASARMPAISMAVEAAPVSTSAPTALIGSVVPTGKPAVTMKSGKPLFDKFVYAPPKGPLSANFAANMGDCAHFIDGKVSKRINPAEPSSMFSSFVDSYEPLGIKIGCVFSVGQ